MPKTAGGVLLLTQCAACHQLLAEITRWSRGDCTDLVPAGKRSFPLDVAAVVNDPGPPSGPSTGLMGKHAHWDVETPVVLDVVPRSGSNLLRLVLNAHPEVYIASGSALINLIARAEQPWAPLRDLLAQEQPETARREVDLLAAVRQFHCAFWTTSPEPAALGKTHAPRWGFLDYTLPPPASQVSLRQVFPRARFVALVRDGRDVVASWLANWQLASFRSGLSQRNPAEVARYWVQKTSVLVPTTTLVLKLEELHAPATRRAALERLAAWCDLTFPDTWKPLLDELPWINSEKQILARWQTDLDPRTLATLEHVRGFADQLARFGYR